MFSEVGLNDNNEVVDLHGTFWMSGLGVLWPEAIPHRQRLYAAGDKVYVAMQEGGWCGVVASTVKEVAPSVIAHNRCECLHHRDRQQDAPFHLVRPERYAEYSGNCKRAVMCWLLVSRKWLPKDMRRLIGEYVWDTRYDNEWETVPVPPQKLRRNPARSVKKRIKYTK